MGEEMTSSFLQKQNDWIEGSKQGFETLSSTDTQQWGEK
jgi:hypothetical protein